MKQQFLSSFVLINFAFFSYCLANDIFSYRGIQFDPLTVAKEFAAIINILIAEKQSNNEDADLDITQLIVKYGYPVEEHYVETIDGYNLTMFRIPKKGPAVFLMHGLLTSADDWITGGPEDGLAYLLATTGYDVWMGNARGTKHSRQHVGILPDSPKFWEFSWDDIGRKDLPAMIDYILHTTNKEKLAYIGHSQGTTTFFVMCSEIPSYNDKISTMIALAPLAWSAHIRSPIARYFSWFNYYEMIMVKWFRIAEILPKPITVKYQQAPLCEIGNGIICSTIFFFFCGFDYEQINKTNLPVIFGHSPSGASVYQLIHYLQNIASGSFRKYDYGEDKNLEMYGSSKPPKYAVENIKAPVALFFSANDWLSDVKDITTLKNNLPNVRDFYQVPFKKFNHIDYLWAKDAKRLVYARILELLKFEPKILKASEINNV